MMFFTSCSAGPKELPFQVCVMLVRSSLAASTFADQTSYVSSLVAPTPWRASDVRLSVELEGCAVQLQRFMNKQKNIVCFYFLMFRLPSRIMPLSPRRTPVITATIIVSASSHQSKLDNSLVALMKTGSREEGRKKRNKDLGILSCIEDNDQNYLAFPCPSLTKRVTSCFTHEIHILITHAMLEILSCLPSMNASA